MRYLGSVSSESHKYWKTKFFHPAVFAAKVVYNNINNNNNNI